jgi:monofunctional biosynthetic peptidoglycan transglycosylase
MIRRIFRWLFLGVLGILVGLVLYEAVLLVRVSWLRAHNPSSTSLIDTRASEARAKGQQPRREQVWVPLDKISSNLQRAVLAGEDTNFTTHRGFDYEAIQKAFEQAQRESARQAKAEGEDDDWLPNLPEFKRGGSTISQQLAKNLYLSSQRSFLRKGQEAALTIMLERTLTKRRILEIYLNVIEWGDGIYGAEAAAQHYFHKPALSLSASEAAFLSAMIPNPRTVFNPQTNPRRVARRQRIILRGMPYIKLP